MVRLAFFGLLLINLMLFAGSQWQSPESSAIASAAGSATTSAAGARAGTPSRILLASERASTNSALDGGAGASGDAAAAAPDGSTPGAAAMSTATGEGGAAGASDASMGGAGTAAGGATDLRRCMSMGPFADLEMTARVTAMLKEDGYEPRQRPANGAVPDSFMVMVGPLKGEAEQRRVIGRLKRGGLDDAFALPRLDSGYAVSVGLFSERRRAERRVVVVDRTGLKSAIVERSRPGTVYWIDFDLQTPAGEADALDALFKTSDPSQKWQVAPCPEPRSVG